MSSMEFRPNDISDDVARRYCLRARLESHNRAAEAGDDETAWEIEEMLDRATREEMREDASESPQARLARILGDS